MSKLFLLISLIGFYSITASGNGTPPKKINNSTPAKFGSSTPYGFGTKNQDVKVPCLPGKDCLGQNKAQFQKRSLDGLKGEDRVKANCYNQSGGYGDKYQACLSNNGVFAVNRNINSDDRSQSDARLCYVGDPICDKCLAQSAGAKTNGERRNQVAACIKTAQAPKPTPKPKTVSTPPKPKKEETVVAHNGECGKKSPQKCTTQDSCAAANGVWNGTACAVSPCPASTTPDEHKSSTENLCKCDNDTNYWVERGTEQVCPSSCSAENHQQYNMVARSCICMAGYHDPANAGVCIAQGTPSSGTSVASCLQELQEKANSCGSAATTAVNKCDANNKDTSGDTIGAMQSLLQGATDVMGASGSADNCSNLAIANSTGYYALDGLREKCDGEINTCQTTCSDVKSYITSNKDRVVQACREKDWMELGCSMNNPYRDVYLENEWKARWDADRKVAIDQQIEQMLASVSTSNAKCQSGTSSSDNAVSNREKMLGYLDEANNTVKAANKCQCQLTSGGSNCDNAPGPAECAANPSLAGCAQATVNCLSAGDTSPKCACFKNPNSNECKNLAAAGRTAGGGSGISSFAGPNAAGKQSAMTGFGNGGSSSGGSGSGSDVSGDLSGLNSDEVTAGGTSETTTADNGSPFTAAGSAGGSGGGGSFGNGADGAAGKTDGEGSDSKGLRGLFETAKGALSGLFKDKKNDKSTYTGADGITRDADGNPIGAANKWRPRGMVRGLAGNDTEIAGKFEDIWKVMNKQYKVQDQKDSFIFGEKN